MMFNCLLSYLFVYRSVYLSVCLSVYLLSIYVCLLYLFASVTFELGSRLLSKLHMRFLGRQVELKHVLMYPRTRSCFLKHVQQVASHRERSVLFCTEALLFSDKVCVYACIYVRASYEINSNSLIPTP